MPIPVTCPNCQTAYQLADVLAGKKVRCAKCQGAIAAPQSAIAAAPPKKEGTAAPVKSEAAGADKKPTPAKTNAARKDADPDEKPAPKAKTGGSSGLIIAVLLFRGVGVFGCLGCSGAVAWWYYAAAKPARPDPNPVAVNEQKKVDQDAKDKKQTDAGDKDGAAKDGPPSDGKKDEKKDGKKDGPANDANPSKDKKDPPPAELPKPPAYTDIGSYSQRTFTFKKGTRLLGDLVWARDGKSFYALTDAGALVHLNGDTGAVIIEKAYAQKCGNLALSGQGLLLSVLDAQEIWIVDPENLETVKKKIPVPSVARVTAGFDAQYAVATVALKVGMHVIDLERGAIVKSFPDFARHVRASPDGRFVFAEGDAEQLVRFRLDKDQLVQEDVGPRIALNAQSVCISPDSRYVCLVAADGNGQGHPNHPPASPRATFIYPATNLKRPICVLNSGPDPQAVGFDPKGGFIVTQNNVKPIIIYTYTGIKRVEFEVADVKGSDVREFAVSPLGFEMLIRTDERIVHVKMTKKQ